MCLWTFFLGQQRGLASFVKYCHFAKLPLPRFLSNKTPGKLLSTSSGNDGYGIGGWSLGLMIIDHAFDDFYRQIFRTISNHLDHRSAWTRSWRRRVSAKRSWRSSRWLRSRCPPSPPSCSWQSWVMTRNDCVACQAQRVGDIPRLQGLSQQLELCNAKQQDLLRERDDHQRLLRFAFITSLLRKKETLHVLFFWHLLHLYSFMAPLLLKERQYLHSFANYQIICLFKLWLLGSVLKRVRRPEKCRLPVSTGFAAASWHLFEVYDTSSLVRV